MFKNFGDIICSMAEEINLWRKNFNEAQNTIEKLTGNTMLKIKMESVDEIINNYKYNNDEEFMEK